MTLSASTFASLLTFTRGSTATYFDSTGTLQTAAVDTPRFDYDPVTHAALGLLIEESRTNLLLNSATLATQSATVSATAYTLSFYGTGTVTLSGTYSGSLVGSGAFPARSTLTFTPTAGTLTLTVSGTVENAQLEAGSFATSYIPTTTTAVTRAADVCYRTLGTEYMQGEGTLLVEAVIGCTSSVGPVSAQFSDGTTDNFIIAGQTVGATTKRASAVRGARGTIYLTAEGSTVTRGNTMKAVGAWSAGELAGAIDGILLTQADPPAIPNVITKLYVGSVTGTVQFWNGHIKSLTYYPTRLSDAELQSLTA